MATIIFRADASTSIGMGHIMRCLTLAVELKQRGNLVSFICKTLTGHMGKIIQERGFSVNMISCLTQDLSDEDVFEWQTDAAEVIDTIGKCEIDFLVVDHYKIENRWHTTLRHHVKKIIVIDDLANRQYDCDWLLDQTYMREQHDYKNITPTHCRYLLGAEYALLRPDFLTLRDMSITRRDATTDVKRLMVSMGGSDEHNISGQLLTILERVNWGENSPQVDLIVGALNPNITGLQNIIASGSLEVKVVVNASNMAELMAQADLAIGAGGTTSWERCCMGLPALVVECAQNQLLITKKLTEKGAIRNLGWFESLEAEIVVNEIEQLIRNHHLLQDMSLRSRDVCVGTGVVRCVEALGCS